MNAVMVCIALATLGIDVGWQPLPDGGMEYIIQIAPQTLDLLKSGELIQSDVPAEVRDIRAYRFMVGTGKLPRELPRQTDAPPPPRTLPPEPDGKPISAESTALAAQTGGPQQHETQRAGDAQPPTEAARPWMVLMLVALGLFASLGGNVYLGWITWEIHRRYRALLRQPHQAASADSSSL